MSTKITLSFAAAASALMLGPAAAADLLSSGGPDPVYSSPMFNFEGFYVGGSLGAGFLDGSDAMGSVGVAAGANFALSDALVAGAEFQANWYLGDEGFEDADVLLLGKVGGYLTDDTIIYGTGGTGWVGGPFSYALGGGVELAVADQLSVRGELLGTGEWGDGPDGARATVGALWHMN